MKGCSTLWGWRWSSKGLCQVSGKSGLKRSYFKFFILMRILESVSWNNGSSFRENINFFLYQKKFQKIIYFVIYEVTIFYSLIFKNIYIIFLRFLLIFVVILNDFDWIFATRIGKAEMKRIRNTGGNSELKRSSVTSREQNIIYIPFVNTGINLLATTNVRRLGNVKNCPCKKLEYSI